MADAETHAPSSGAAQHEQRRKRKQEKLTAMKDGIWERCMFRIVRKNRFCNLERVGGTEFCGNHLPDGVEGASKRAKLVKPELRGRVPCPLGGAHTVYLYDLEKHVKVCNKLKEAEAVKRLPYFSENINSGSHASTERTVDTLQPRENPAGVTVTENNDKEHSEPSEQQEKGLIDKLASMDFADLVARINAAFDRCVGSIPLDKRHHVCCDPLLAEKAAAGASKNVLRHIEQQASILGHMEHVKLLDPQAAFLELGAGRGMLSLALAQELPNSQYVLIDRSGSRGKADHVIRDGDGSTEQKERHHLPKVLRAKIDIRHLNLAGIQEIAETPVVAMSKHLCGVATDLSLRALRTLPRPMATDSGDVSEHFRGIAVALCCHHACQWEDYVNPDFFISEGFQVHEFPLVTSMTSWATCAMKAEGDTVEHVLSISKAERAVLGRKCKRLLDVGRVRFLQQQLQLQAQLVHYCEVEDSVENCLLLAWR